MPFHHRLGLLLALAFLPVAAAAADGVVSPNGPCLTAYVAPYADQCTFAYHSIKKDRSPKNLQDAFSACDRAQSASLACVKSPTRQIHVVALSALYTSVTAQAEIALFAGQYAMAESLLREKLSVIDAIEREARPGDTGLTSARAATQGDLADAMAGECTWRALATAGRQQALIHAHDYGDLAALLQTKASAYQACAHIPVTAPHRAYVEYLGYVALEEGGRAAQAAGQTDVSGRLYRSCIAGTARSTTYAAPRVKALLYVVNALCRGRLSGKYRVDQPAPIDADDGRHFRPLTLPTS